MRILALLSFLIAIVACNDRAAQRAAATERNRPDSTIYVALLNSLRPAARRTLVVRQYEELPDSWPGSAWLASWAAAQPAQLDSALIVAVARDRHAGDVAATVGGLPGVRWIERDSVRAEILRRDENIRIVQLSRVAYSPGSARAMVYASMWCGARRGSGSFYQFQHLRAGGWHLVRMARRFNS